MPSDVVKRISYQNFVAAALIQRCWRGHLSRKRTWGYGGARYIFHVKNVQCAWRVHMAKKKLIALWYAKVFSAAHKLQTMYYKWHSRRLRWILHLTFLKKCVVKVQSAYRRRMAKKLLAVIKAAFRNKTALRLQTVIRRFLGKCRALRRRRLMHTILQFCRQPAVPTTNATSDSNSNIGPEEAHQKMMQGLVEKIIRILYKLLLEGQFHHAFVDAERLLQTMDFLTPSMLIPLPTTNNPIASSATVQCKSNSESLTPWRSTLFVLQVLVLTIKGCCWGKYGRTKQVNVGALEQSVGTALCMLYRRRNQLSHWRSQQQHRIDEYITLMRAELEERRLLQWRIEQEQHALHLQQLQLQQQQERHRNSVAGGRLSISNLQPASHHGSEPPSRRDSNQSIQQQQQQPHYVSSAASLASSVSSLSLHQRPAAASGQPPVFAWELSPDDPVTGEYTYNTVKPTLDTWEDEVGHAFDRRQWLADKYSLAEILDVFHQIATWSQLTLLSHHDGCYCQAALLHTQLYLRHGSWLLQTTSPQLFQPLVIPEPSSITLSPMTYDTPANNNGVAANNNANAVSALRKDSSASIASGSSSITSVNGPPAIAAAAASANDDNKSTASSKSPSLSRSRRQHRTRSSISAAAAAEATAAAAAASATSAAPIVAVRKPATVISPSDRVIIPIFGQTMPHMEDPNYIDFVRLQKRAWKLVDHAKHLVSAASPEAFELTQRLPWIAAMNVPGALLYQGMHTFTESVLVSVKQLRSQFPASLSPSTISSPGKKPGSKQGKRQRSNNNSPAKPKGIDVGGVEVASVQEEEVDVIVSVEVRLTASLMVLHNGSLVIHFGHIHRVEVMLPMTQLPLISSALDTDSQTLFTSSTASATTYTETTHMEITAPAAVEAVLQGSSSMDLMRIYALLRSENACPLQPLVLFPQELKLLATTHNLYVPVKSALQRQQQQQLQQQQQQNHHEDDEGDHHHGDGDGSAASQETGEPEDDASEGMAKAAARHTSGLSKAPVLDTQKYKTYLMESLSLRGVSVLSTASVGASFVLPTTSNLSSENVSLVDPALLRDDIPTSVSLPVSTYVQPIVALSLSFVQEKRDRSITQNEVRYATLLLQRCVRGFAGRLRFRKVAARKRIIMRRWWLGCKVLDRWKAMRARHEAAAVVVQANVHGWLWRRLLRTMQRAALIVQCAFRIYRAKCKVAQELERKFGGPQVVEMIPGGRLVQVSGRRFMLRVFRCGNNYRFEGFDMLQGLQYAGAIHQPELKSQLRKHNDRVIQERGGDATSMASKDQQIMLWQTHKVLAYLLDHVHLVHRIYAGTSLLGGASLQLQPEASDGNDLCIVVSLDRPNHMVDKLQATVLPHPRDHPFMKYAAPKPKPKTALQLLLEEQKKREQSKQQQRQYQQRKKSAASVSAGSLPPSPVAGASRR